MTTAVEILFHHAAEQSFCPYLDIPEYDSYAQTGDKAEERLRQFLTPEQSKLLDDLRHTNSCCTSIAQEAAFQAGLAIGLELSRL